MLGNEPVLQETAVALGTRSGLIKAITLGTLLAGSMDIAAAILSWLPRGVPPARVLQSVASGLMGREAFAGGTSVAVLGLLLHFAIMCLIVSAFVLASRRWPMLTPGSVFAAAGYGVAYGVAVYLVMTYAVVPLSASPLRLPDLRGFLEGVAVHIACVGLPIALLSRWFALRG